MGHCTEEVRKVFEEDGDEESIGKIFARICFEVDQLSKRVSELEDRLDEESLPTSCKS